MTARFPASSWTHAWRDFEKTPGRVVELQMCCLDGTAHALERRLVRGHKGDGPGTRVATNLGRSPWAMPVFSRTMNGCQKLLARPMGPFVAADCWLAAENLMLAAGALGLGTCCIGSAIPVLNSPDIKSELGIPADVEAVAPIIVGVPSGPTRETPRKDPEILFWK